MDIITLEHFGPVFPDEYKTLNFKFNESILPPLAEEMLWHYAAKIETDYVKDKIFNKNFLSCLKKELKGVYSFPKDFEQLFKEMNLKREEIKNSKTKEEKEIIRQEKLKFLDDYMYAYVNDEPMKIASPMIEGPGIILTRGESPIKGLWKYRVKPEDVIINFTSKTGQPPEPPKGHKWKKIVSSKSLYTCKYVVKVGDITERPKQIQFAADTIIKCERDENKFDKAFILAKNWNSVISYIKSYFNNEDEKIRDSAIISYLITKSAIRVGNEKDESIEAMTVGASTLLCKNLLLKENNTIELNFLGKDSVPYKNDIKICSECYITLEKIFKDKKLGDKIFSATSTDVSNFLKQKYDFLTPKLFRTALGTSSIIEALKITCKDLKKESSLSYKIYCFNQANIETAKKLNHQKNISKNYKESLNKSYNSIKEKKEKFKEWKINNYEIKKEFYKKKIKSFKDKNYKEGIISFKNKLNKLEETLLKKKETLLNEERKIDLKKNLKNIATGTSKSAYCSPKIAYSWCKYFEIPIEKIYTKTLVSKFSWAEKTEKNYWLEYPTIEEK